MINTNPQKFKNIRLSKKRKPPISGQKSLTRWCPLIRESTVFRIPYNYCMFRTLLQSESRHIQSPKYIQKSVVAYSGIFRRLCNAPIMRTLPYSELCHIQNFGRFKNRGIRILFIQAYSGIFRHIQKRQLCSCYRTVPSAIWEIFSEFLIFCNLFLHPLGE